MILHVRLFCLSWIRIPKLYFSSLFLSIEVMFWLFLVLMTFVVQVESLKLAIGRYLEGAVDAVLEQIILALLPYIQYLEPAKNDDGIVHSSVDRAILKEVKKQGKKLLKLKRFTPRHICRRYTDRGVWKFFRVKKHKLYSNRSSTNGGHVNSSLINWDHVLLAMNWISDDNISQVTKLQCQSYFWRKHLITFICLDQRMPTLECI